MARVLVELGAGGAYVPERACGGLPSRTLGVWEGRGSVRAVLGDTRVGELGCGRSLTLPEMDGVLVN